MREGRDGMSVFLFLFVLVCLALGHGGCSLGPPLVISKNVETRVVFTPTNPRVGLSAAYDATVLITVAFENEGVKMEGCGSGSLVAPNLVLTAAHVVLHGTPQIMISFGDGKTFPAKVSRVDRDRDLALVGFDGHAMVMPLSVASSAPTLLSSVWNFGAPLCRPGYASAGLWMGKTEEGRIFSGGIVWPGMSGGPVVDELGAIVGVNDAVGTDGGEVVIPQMGMLVDWQTIKEFLTNG